MFDKWLTKVALQQNQIELQAANRNPKAQDNTFYVLLDLYEKGYDMVTWVRTDGEPDCKLCQFYDSHQTTWRLSEFLGLTRTAEQDNDIEKVAAADKPWVDLDDSEKLDVLRTPITAYNYAKRLGFQDVPSEVVEEIAKDLTVSEYYVSKFLEEYETGDIPKKIVDTVGYDASFVDRIQRDYQNQDSYPKELKFRGATKEEVALMDQEGWNNTLLERHKWVDEQGNTILRHEAPLFEHSHINCKCQLMVWKSSNPSDVVYVDASGKK